MKCPCNEVYNSWNGNACAHRRSIGVINCDPITDVIPFQGEHMSIFGKIWDRVTGHRDSLPTNAPTAANGGKVPQELL
jgi:hypothetical protein